MKFKLQWPVKAVTPIEKKSVALGMSESLGSFLMYGNNYTAYSPASALDLYDKSTAVSIPINYIAEAFASISPVVKYKDDLVDEHPVLDLLHKPSPYFTRTLMMEFLGKEYLITGETSVVGIGGIARPPLELQPISARYVTVVPAMNGLAQAVQISGNTLAGSYDWTKQGARIRYLDGGFREIKLIRNYSTRNNSLLRGQSPLVSASKEALQHIKGGNHNISLLDNGGRVSLVFAFDEDMDDDEFEEMKARVRNQYGGASNAGQIGVTSGGGKLDIKEFGKSNKDMDFANLQKMAQQAVALQYKFPLPLLTTDAATFNNYKEAKAALYTEAVLPLADRIYGGLTEFLMPRFGLDPADYRITYDKTKIEALMAIALDQLQVRKNIGIETDNELRGAIGLDSYPEGNAIYKPANMVAVGQAVETEEQNEPTPVVLREQ